MSGFRLWNLNHAHDNAIDTQLISEITCEPDMLQTAGTDANDLSCVKTPQARERLELFFPDRPKAIAHDDLRSEIHNRKDDPFYQISTPPRFHTTKTHSRPASFASLSISAPRLLSSR